MDDAVDVEKHKKKREMSYEKDKEIDESQIIDR